MMPKFAINSIFWRIFIWFWIFSFSVSGLIVLTVYLTADSMPPPDPGLLPGKMLNNLSVFAQPVLEKHGRKELEKMLAGLKDDPAEIFLSEEHELPAEIRPVIETRKDESLFTFEKDGRMTLYKRLNSEGASKGFLVFSSPSFKGLFNTFFFDRLFLLRIFLVLFSAAFVCYLLARTIVEPLIKLKNISSQLGQHDLKCRPDISLMNRKDEIGEVSRDFFRMAERVEGLVKSQQSLLHEISHELKSPLTRLQLTVEGLETRINKELSGELRRIEMETIRLRSLVDQILMVARLEEGVKGGLELIDSEKLLQEMAEDLKIETDAKRQKILIQNNSSPKFNSFRLLICRAVENILRNAIIQSPAESTIELISDTETLDGSQYWKLSVIDNGPGIPEDKLNDVLQPFSTIGNTRKHSGSGMGLSIVARIVKELHAELKLENLKEPQKNGLKVTICFPVT